jgi:uncharacterized protein
MDRMLEALDAVARARCSAAEPAHDYLHVARVAKMAKKLCDAEGADAGVAVAAALLHELFNYPKGHPESRRSGDVCAEHAESVLRDAGCDAERISRVCYAIRVHPFSLGILPETLEAKILQDADRLDAIGAIGIARCFATCADMKRPFYDASDPLCRRRDPDDKRWGVDHFFTKLLRIGGSLHTRTAREIAARRTRFMTAYLDELDHDIG